MSFVKFKLGIVKLNEELIRTMAKAIKELVEFEWCGVDDYFISLLAHCNRFHDYSMVQWSNLLIYVCPCVITYQFKIMIVILVIQINRLKYFGPNGILLGVRFNDR